MVLLLLLSFVEISELNANSADTDQTPHCLNEVRNKVETLFQSQQNSKNCLTHQCLASHKRGTCKQCRPRADTV